MGTPGVLQTAVGDGRLRSESGSSSVSFSNNNTKVTQNNSSHTYDLRPSRLISRGMSSFSRLSSFSSSSTNSSGSRRSLLLKRSSISKSLRRLESSSRLNYSCHGGTELSQLYLSSPEDDTRISIGSGKSGSSGGRRSSWYESADLYGRRKSFRRLNSYAKFLDVEMMSNINEEEDEEEERMLLIEETTDTVPELSKRRRNYCSCTRLLTNQAVIVPLLMIVDLILGVSLSIYDSNLLRNVPNFNFPLCYALVQKLTNAVASLVLIRLSRKWERDSLLSKQQQQQSSVVKKSSSANPPPHPAPTIELPSLPTFKQHVIPLSAVALFQTISSSFANESLTIIPLQLFKVCLMCGPIFVAFITTCIEGQVYSKGRMFALSLIGIGACRAVYSESENADNPRYIMIGAGYALAASAFSGIGLVLSSVLMHHQGEEDDDDDNNNEIKNDYGPTTIGKKNQSNPESVELNPLSLLFYLSCEQVLMLSAYLFPWDALITSQAEVTETAGGEVGEFAAFFIYMKDNPWRLLSYLMIGSIMSLCLAVLTFVLVNRTSPVATSLLGNVRSIATVGISSIVFGGSGHSAAAAFGYTLTLMGGVVYGMEALRNG